MVVSRCSLLFAREDGAWRLAIVREWPGDGLSLRDLDWMIGTWEVKRAGTAVTTTYEWTKNKTFIRCRLAITRDGETTTGTQMIGKMPSTGGLHVWTFGDEGGIGDADVTRDGKKWVFAARGSTADGQVITATNILTPLDADSFTWQSVGAGPPPAGWTTAGASAASRSRRPAVKRSRRSAPPAGRSARAGRRPAGGPA